MGAKRTRKPKNPFVGIWHIHEMEMWDEDYCNMEVQAFIEVRKGDVGNFQFGLVSGHLGGFLETEDGKERFFFSWEGQDEMDPASGMGWLRLAGEDEVEGLISLHMGDRSEFKARRAQ